MIDWTICPRCGADLEIEESAEVTTYTPIDLDLDDEGNLRTATHGYAEQDYDGGEHIWFQCKACADWLPDEYQQALRHALYV